MNAREMTKRKPAAERIGKKLAERAGLFDMTEGDIWMWWSSPATPSACPTPVSHAYKLKTYKTTWSGSRSSRALVASFRRECWPAKTSGET
jgi:hypothetical protein